MITYATVADEILAVRPRSDRHRELVARSDDLLARLETLNLGHYGALREWGHVDDCRLTHTLTRAVNELLLEVGLDPRRLTTTREAMDAVFDAQTRLFGHDEDGAEAEEDQP